ncbi:hypothetical protein FJT64_015826 [Amphibalanus amphitrite]|uniref:Uncharacterized protein n=1 Tax=Amphibalanus amphitrite TaxID=1232801 RepID=A0A6A4XG88_AMPAM|nr:hypothetical protein FJT64_015826 [Amphibalanus amphitrite]
MAMRDAPNKYKFYSGAWSRTNMMQRNVDTPDNPTYSQLFRANDLRAAGVDTTFQILVLFGSNVGFHGPVPVQQSLEVNTYTGSSYMTSVTIIGAMDAGKAVLPWMPTAGNALLSLTTDQGSVRYFHTMINTPGTPYLGSAQTNSEYYVRE